MVLRNIAAIFNRFFNFTNSTGVITHGLQNNAMKVPGIRMLRAGFYNLLNNIQALLQFALRIQLGSQLQSLFDFLRLGLPLPLLSLTRLALNALALRACLPHRTTALRHLTLLPLTLLGRTLLLLALLGLVLCFGVRRSQDRKADTQYASQRPTRKGKHALRHQGDPCVLPQQH